MKVIENIKKIRLEKGISQECIAMAIGCDQSNWNKIETGKQQLKVNQLEKIAEILGVDVIYLFTYPKVYVDATTVNTSERISVTFEVAPDKKDVIMQLVSGAKVL